MNHIRLNLMALICIFMLLLGFSACTSGKVAATNSTNQTIQATTELPETNSPTEPATTKSTSLPTEPPTDESTEQPTEVTESEPTIPEEAQDPYEAATAFLRETTDDMYIYTEHDFLPKTAAGLTQEQLQRLKDEISQQPDNTVIKSADEWADKAGGTLTERLEKFPQYYNSYVYYYRNYRKESGIMREDYHIRYFFHSIEQDGNFAELHLGEGISFTYNGEIEGSAEGIDWVVWLWNHDGRWIVLDMLDDFGRNLGRDIDHDYMEDYENWKNNQEQSTQE